MGEAQPNSNRRSKTVGLRDAEPALGGPPRAAQQARRRSATVIATGHLANCKLKIAIARRGALALWRLAGFKSIHLSSIDYIISKQACETGNLR
jgi:hypothetical protein